MRYLTCLLLACLAFTGCANLGAKYIYHVEHKHDDFNGTQSDYMMVDDVPSNNGYCEINLAREITEKKDTTYSIFFTYLGNEWMFIPQGQSLTFLVDGKRMTFSGDGSGTSRDVDQVGGVSEISAYQTSLDNVWAIAYGHFVRYKVTGDKLDVEGTLSENNLSRMRDFLTSCQK